MTFTAGDGGKTEVTSFGIRTKDDYAYAQLRKQPRVLYANDFVMRGYPGQNSPEFVVDLDGKSEPTQVIVAQVPPKGTLQETLASVEKLIGGYKPKLKEEGVGINDVLLVPDVVYSITHHFAALEHKKLLNPSLKGQRIDVAQEDLIFRLDRAGAELQAESKLYMKPSPSLYICDRPFLLLMRKRGETKPYFVMWVDNAELLTKF